jgi:hypothetical protein
LPQKLYRFWEINLLGPPAVLISYQQQASYVRQIVQGANTLVYHYLGEERCIIKVVDSWRELHMLRQKPLKLEVAVDEFRHD